MCVSPYIVTKRDGTLVPVPCGHCYDCLKRYKNDWIFRLKQECKGLICPIKVELTYAPENVPVAYNDEVGEWQSYLDKRDVQLFLKRLRKSCPEFTGNLRYYAVGEYGKDRNRCHVHIILMSPCIMTSHQYYTKILQAWRKGFIYIKRIDISKGQQQLAYVTGYLNKLDKSSHITPPFRLMSKSIGLNYLTDKMLNYYFSTFDTGAHDVTGWHKLPRYYRKKLDEYSSRSPFLKRCDMTYSDVICSCPYVAKGLESHFDYFCKNFKDVYTQVYRNEVHISRVFGYRMPKKQYSVNEVFEKFCSTIKDITDARYNSDEKIRNLCVKHGKTRLYDSDLVKVRGVT